MERIVEPWFRLAAAFLVGAIGWTAVVAVRTPIELAFAAPIGLGAIAALIVGRPSGLLALWLGIGTVVAIGLLGQRTAIAPEQAFYLGLIAIGAGVGYSGTLAVVHVIARQRSHD